MNSIKQLFDYLNDVSFPYVVMRNWENLPYSVELGLHSDLDLLVYDLDHFLEIIPEAKREYPHPRVQFKLPIENSFVFMDIRSVGDNYYPRTFQENILKTREWNEKGFWTPNAMHHRIALAYHVAHHKNKNNYEKYLGTATPEQLAEALRQSNVGWVKPNDPTVGQFNPYWKGATAVVSKSGTIITKQQVSFLEYDLIENEGRILKRIQSDHFPRLFDYMPDTKTILLEDCGEPLSTENLPKDWKEQMAEILEDLQFNGIMHRDIRPDNFMVKEGIIKLIDFGWARGLDEEPDSVPDCLGFPYKPSYGFDDAFSMRKVIKGLEYQLEEV